MEIVGGNLEAQRLLEEILEESKPRLPPETDGLHCLLATPFRYYPLPDDSRLRDRTEPGVFMKSPGELDSDALRKRAKSIPVRLFQFGAASNRLIDLTRNLFSAQHADWTHPSDYTHSLASVNTLSAPDRSVRRPPYSAGLTRGRKTQRTSARRFHQCSVQAKRCGFAAIGRARSAERT